jgi:lysophospholipase L1-like esterase
LPPTDRARLRRLKAALANAALVVASLCLLGLVGEGALRAYQWYRGPISFFTAPYRQSLITLDDHLGWRATENARVQTTMKSADGSDYRVALSQDRHGFRLTPVPSERSRARVLVIGDSFTHAREVSDDKTYYFLLSRALPADVFAYGVAGYGTLQEYLALRKLLPIVRPDLIIWQYCPNDFINNSFALETRSTTNNNGMRRPYLVEGTVRHLFPKPATRRLREFAIRYSRLLYLATTRFDLLVARFSRTASVEDEIERLGLDMAEFSEAVRVTDEIVRRTRELVGDTPIVAFSSLPGPSTLRAFADISARHRIDFLAGVSDALRAAEEQGHVVTTADRAHWNEAGHQVVAEALAAALRSADLLRRGG